MTKKSLELKHSINITSSNHLDSKFEVLNNTERDSLLKNKRIEEGHIIYHKQDNKLYYLKSYPNIGSSIGAVWAPITANLSNSLDSDSEVTALTSKGAKEIITLINSLNNLDPDYPPVLVDTTGDSFKDSLRFTFAGGVVKDVDLEELKNNTAFTQAIKKPGGQKALQFLSPDGTTNVQEINLSDWFDQKLNILDSAYDSDKLGDNPPEYYLNITYLQDTLLRFDIDTQVLSFQEKKNALINLGIYSTAAIKPEYEEPSVNLDLTDIVVEKGSDLNSLGVDILFSPGDSGDILSYSLHQDNIEVSVNQANLITLTNIVDTIEFKGIVSYDEGETKQNNIGEPIPEGKILTGTKESSVIKIIPKTKVFYGSVSSLPTTSVEVRALDSVYDDVETIFLNTGTINKLFVIALPPGISITSVEDTKNSYVNITSEYISKPDISVEDAGGNLSTYTLWALENSIPYSIETTHKITILK